MNPSPTPTRMKPPPSFTSPPAGVPSTYQRMKADMRNVVALLNAAIPHAGNYFAAQLPFYDAKEAVY